MESKSMGEIALSLAIFVALASLFAYQRTRKEEMATKTTIENQDTPHSYWTTFDPKEQQDYYISQGHDGNSSFYEVRQYQEDKHRQFWEDNYTIQPVATEWELPWLPGVDREFALVITSDFFREQFSHYWQTIFVLDCNHYLPSVHNIESVRGETYCFICRALTDVIKVVSRRSIFPAEGDSIKTKEDWIRAVENLRIHD